MKTTHQDNFDKLKRELEIAISERDHIRGMLFDANQRVLRLTVAENNAWGELEIAKAEGCIR